MSQERLQMLIEKSQISLKWYQYGHYDNVSIREKK